jgi:hypothetical protein
MKNRREEKAFDRGAGGRRKGEAFERSKMGGDGGSLKEGWRKERWKKRRRKDCEIMMPSVENDVRGAGKWKERDGSFLGESGR